MIKMLNNPLQIIWGTLGLLFMSSCYPGEGVFDEADLDIVVTLYDENINFSSKRTYVLIDTIVPISDEGNQILLTGKFDEQIVDQVKLNLDALGWEEVSPGAGSDVVVLLSKVASLNIDAYSWSNYWWGWWGWYPYWGVYPGGVGGGWYPWYPWGGTVVYSYQTGTLFLEMIDPNQAGPEENTIPSLWGAGINGLLEGSDTEISDRLTRNIDQVFAQSPYLNL